MDLTSKNHNHNSFDQRLKWIQLPQNHNTLIRDPNGSNLPKSQHFDQKPKWIQLPKITTLWSQTQMDPKLPKITKLWSQTQMDPTYQNHKTLITDPNGSNFPKSQHFDQRPKMHPTSQNHNTLIRDPKCIQLPENLPRKITFWCEYWEYLFMMLFLIHWLHGNLYS